jgi:hypothetical protein
VGIEKSLAQFGLTGSIQDHLRAAEMLEYFNMLGHILADFTTAFGLSICRGSPLTSTAFDLVQGSA